MRAGQCATTAPHTCSGGRLAAVRGAGDRPVTPEVALGGRPPGAARPPVWAAGGARRVDEAVRTRVVRRKPFTADGAVPVDGGHLPHRASRSASRAGT